MLRFFVIFSVLLIGLFTLEILQPVEKHVILPFTSAIADISVWITLVFDDNVLAVGNVIRDKTTGFGVRIERGCNGLEALIILFSAIFAFPAPLRSKFIGFVIGFFASYPVVEPRAHHQPFLPGSMELHGLRMVSPLPLAGADYPRCIGGLVDLVANSAQAGVSA
jgi:hypothetical protein